MKYLFFVVYCVLDLNVMLLISAPVKKLFLTIIALLLLCYNGISQHYVPVNTFTTDNGLPSNHIYDMVEDNKGFLWIATNNGVSRFDGKYFQNFSVNDGLPSNDALQVVKDGSGTIWVNCYKEKLVYFNPLTNRFIALNGNKDLDKMAKTFYQITVSKEGNLGFQTGSNGLPWFTLKNTGKADGRFLFLPSKPVISIGGHDYFTTAIGNNGNFLRTFFEGDKLIDSFSIPMTSETFSVFYNGCYYQTNDYCIQKIIVKSVRPVRYTIDSIQFNNSLVRFISLGKQGFAVISNKKIYLMGESNFAIQDSLENESGANTVYIDQSKDLWVGTMDNGLVHYSGGSVKQIRVPANVIQPNFLSIATTNRGVVFAGNYYGKLLEIRNRTFSCHTVSASNRGFWLRKTFCVNNSVVTVSDYFCGVDFKYKIVIGGDKVWKGYSSLKSATLLNDSIVILGSNNGLIKVNINTRNYSLLNSIHDRTLSLVKGTGNLIYYIGTNGLYEYDYDKNRERYITLNNYLQNNKLSALAFAADSTLWAATTTGNILVFKNNQYSATISSSEGLPQNIVCMNVFKNKVWVGSKTGISVISYSWKNNLLDYSINNISKTDGLPSNVVNDFAFYNDTVFAATENGIVTIPFNFPVFRANIVPQLTDVRVNQQRIAITDHFSFAANQNNIALTFAGVDLTGHFLKMQYTTDYDTLWSDLQGNTLNMQLYSGTHQIKIRAVDVNNHAGRNILKLNFIIATPFYKQWWFIALIAVLFPGLIFWYYFNRRKKLLHSQFEKKLSAERTEFEKKLAVEKAGNRITADLHDDIGTNLSSINIYSTVARQLVETDTSKAREILIKLSEQSKNMLENLGEIIWSLKTGKEQFVNIESRIKNYVSDMLSVTNMHYTIEIDPIVNEMKNTRLRKNTLLIVKESINNAVKYSRATEVFVKMRTENNQLVIEIMDNGIGFDKTVGLNGNGLGNMHKRTEELKGTFNLTSNQGKGTHIIVTIPLMELEEEF